ncbi:TolC family protein [Marinobacterium aestuariivivens]|uniref:TolC family protein n=1 Tax=Marinobacterium aestuariivivens TaxID=1698799 RepID=A0ABW2A8P3_9GAMM
MRLTLLVAGLLAATVTFAAPPLTLLQAEQIALARDAESSRLNLLGEAADHQAVAERQLPDPRLSLGAQNLPTDTFSFDQEPMTQLRLALTQQFPAGDSLQLAGNRRQLGGDVQRQQRRDRQLKILEGVRLAWLELLHWQHAQNILREDAQLFRQLRDITRSLYQVGRARQQDLLRAEVELATLDDRLLQARLREQEVQAMLARWIGDNNARRPLAGEHPAAASWSRQPSDIDAALIAHPSVQQRDLQIEIAETGVALAREAYKPAWGLEVAYGWRNGDNADGSDRSDFFSAGVSLQLPLFTGQRQDRRALAAQQEREAAREQRLEWLRQLQAQVAAEQARVEQFDARLVLYRDQLVSQARARAEAALAAYQSNATDFPDLMRSYLAWQALRLEQLRLQTDAAQAHARLAYFLPVSQSVMESPDA